MKQPSAATQRKQYEIKHDIPFIVNIGSRTFRCKYLKGKAQDKISYLHLSQKTVDSENPKDILKALRHNNRIHAKAVAVLILNSYWKLKLIYFIYWRWLYHTYSSKDLNEAMQTVMEANGIEFFFQNTVYLSATNTLKKKMTSQEVEQLLAEQASESAQVSAKSSE
jgi:hypothetical protein